MKTFLSKLLAGAAVLTASVFSNMGIAADDEFYTKMVTANPVIACNTFAIAYANGMYAYGDGVDSKENLDVPYEANTPSAIQLYKDMAQAGITTVKTHLDQDPTSDRVVAKDIAPVVYKELTRACAAARGDLGVIQSLPHLSPFIMDFISRMDKNARRM